MKTVNLHPFPLNNIMRETMRGRLVVSSMVLLIFSDTFDTSIVSDRSVSHIELSIPCNIGYESIDISIVDVPIPRNIS